MKDSKRYSVLAASSVIAGLALLVWLVTVSTAQATACDVPSALYPTIQSAIGDASCGTVNLTDPLYHESVVITRTVTIQGQAASHTTVDGGGIPSRVFDIRPGLVVTLTGLTVAHGETYSGGGAGISSGHSTVILDHVLVMDNFAGEEGGGIYNNRGTVKVANSTIKGNVGRYGGGITNVHGKLIVTNSTLSGNRAEEGGAIITSGGEVTVTNSTLSGNDADWGGGIRSYYEAKLALINSTLWNNDAHLGSGLYVTGSGKVLATNTILANSMGRRNYHGPPLNSLGYNIASDDSCNLTAFGDQPHTEPRLGPLQDNGGFAWTHALLPGSPAVDSGDCSQGTLTAARRGL